MKQLELTRGYVALVDDDDHERLSKYRWTADVRKSGVYAKRYIDKRSGAKRMRIIIYLHMSVMGHPRGGMQIDHKDRNPLNNTKENLRVCTALQNRSNSKSWKENKFGYRGITKRPSGRYGAYIMQNYKKICIGTFKTAELAALAYDQKAKELFGEFANLNFPGE